MSGEKNFKPDMDECQRILEKLVRINTCQPEGNEETLVDAIIEMLPDGTEYTKVQHTPNRASLVAKVKGREDTGGIAFIGHIDTVACNDLENWKYPPHLAKVEDGILYGRGTSDMKGGDAAMLLALNRLVSSGCVPQKSIYFCFTADEENKGMGIRAIAEGKYIHSVDEVIICEPSDEKIGFCEKGALWLKVIIHGIASHASRPELGVNAVEHAIEFSKRLKNCVEGGKEHPVLGSTTVSVTNFHGGIMTNIIPSGAQMELDIRTVPGVSHDDIIREAGKICHDMMEERPSVKMEVQVMNNRPALETSTEDGFVMRVMDTARKTGISTEPKGLYFYTDASQLIPHMPVPFVIAGPGDDAMAHCVNEQIELASVLRYAELYSCYINEYYT